MLSSLLGRDNYLPHQLANRGDRLVFSNGIVLLALVAGLLIVAFNADVTRLIQLYILGVFLSFTLSQAGMVRHWTDLLRRERRRAQALHRKRWLNGIGAAATAFVFVIVLVTKFSHGAWIVVVAAPILFARDEGGLAPLRADRGGARAPGGRRDAARARPQRVLVSNLLAPTLRALAFAEATSPATLRAVKVAATRPMTRCHASGRNAACRCRSW